MKGQYLHGVSVHDVKVGAELFFYNLAKLLLILCAEVVKVSNLQHCLVET